MQFVTRKLLFGLLFSLFIVGCQSDVDPKSQGGGKSDNSPTTSKSTFIPKFNRDSAYAYIAKQVAFGPRYPNSEGHAACRAWLVQKLTEFGATVNEQPFEGVGLNGEKLQGYNIVAQFKPESSKRILFGAHWDTRPVADSPLSNERKTEPILGADDGGSGVGILLEVARQVGANPINMGIDIVLFDIEDSGQSGGNNWAQGSQYWSKNLPYSGNNKPQYGVLLDMVGSKGARFAKEMYSQKYAPSIVTKVWKLATFMGYSNYFIDRNGGQVTDDHYYVNTIARIPMIDIINHQPQNQSGFGSYWHTHNDNMDIIDKATVRAVGKLMLALIYRENAGTI